MAMLIMAAGMSSFALPWLKQLQARSWGICLCCVCVCVHVLSLCACQIVPNFRVRTIPVLGTAPAIFGMAAAAHILCELAAAPFSGEPIIQLTGQQYERALTRLQQREEEVFGSTEGVPVDKDDVSGAADWGQGPCCTRWTARDASRKGTQVLAYLLCSDLAMAASTLISPHTLAT